MQMLEWAPLNIKIGMYTNVSAQDRLCPFCTCINGVVDDIHVLLKCDTYNDLRDALT